MPHFNKIGRKVYVAIGNPAHRNLTPVDNGIYAQLRTLHV